MPRRVGNSPGERPAQFMREHLARGVSSRPIVYEDISWNIPWISFIDGTPFFF